jgi:hypothetical protein
MATGIQPVTRVMQFMLVPDLSASDWVQYGR